MRKVNEIIKVVIGLAIIISIIYGLYLLVTYLFVVFTSLQKEVSAAIIAAMSTIIVSVLSITFGKYYERKRIIEQELREKKIPMYEEFIEFYFNVLMSKKITGKEITQKEMVRFFNKFTQKLTVWGSDEVVSLWSNFRRKTVENPHNTKENIFEFEKLLLAIRKDTGHKNKNIKQGDLLGLFINDIDKYTQE